MKTRLSVLFSLLIGWGVNLNAQSGQTIDLSFTFNDDLRTYQLYVPADYDGSEAWPLILNLHGFGSNPGIQTFTAQMNQIADTAQFLVAYPQGLPSTGPDGSTGTGWNADWWTGRDDVGALNQLIDHAWTNYQIDLSKVYATGLDNGGQMSLSLACELNDRLAAVAGVAIPFTIQQTDSCTLDQPTPALLMHGTADVLTPYNGFPGVLLSAPELATAWAAKNSCGAVPDTMALPDINTEDSSFVNLYTFGDCSMGSEVRLYETVGGGHTWSGGPPVPPGFEILGNVNRDVNSSVEMWQFFQRFSHPNPRAGTIIEEGNVGLLSRSLMVQSIERTYQVYVPAGFEDKEDWPVVFNLHGFASSGNDQLVVSDMNAVADTAGFLVVYPQGLERESLGDTGPGWNGGRYPELVDDVAFFDLLIDELYVEFGIDLSRVYATGLSQGGVMTYLLASDLGDRIAAIAAVAATMENTLEYTPTRSVPILQIHGTADGLAPYDGSDVLPLISVDSSLNFWLNYNNCAEGQSIEELPDLSEADNSTVTKITYTGCPEGAEIIHYRVNGGGHTWPGGPGSPVFFGPTNQDFHASSAIWNFFSQYEHPNPLRVPQLLEKTIMVDTLEREYLLYVPAAYDGSEPWPLVFNLHGAGSNAMFQMIASGMNAVADTAHFLIAYPAGISNRSGDAGWNEPNLPEIQDDIQFVSDMIDAISSEYMLDPARVYATGMSNGGGMSFTLACQLSDRIAAIASVAAPGTFIEECQPSRPIPIMYIHGTADVIVPFQGGPSPVVPITFPAARDRVEFWVNNNECTEDPIITEFEDINTADSSTVTLEQYSNCSNAAEVFFYVITNGGHTWPGGPAAQIPPGFEPFFGNINQDIIASSEIWNFFNRFTLTPDSTNAVSELLSQEEINLQVFPNPFSDQLTFTFETPKTQRVQLFIFNSFGQSVKTLINQKLPQGHHRIEWESLTRSLPSGMYYYQLWIGNKFISKPILLNR